MTFVMVCVRAEEAAGERGPGAEGPSVDACSVALGMLSYWASQMKGRDAKHTMRPSSFIQLQPHLFFFFALKT